MTVEREKKCKRNTPAETAEPLLAQIDLKGKAIKLMNTTLWNFELACVMYCKLEETSPELSAV